ncbi:hypothetical protein G6011_01041 [Alternaria panax]|uniref:DUF7703 domain-containing protein n=1 Tax=Alternaria panax TaxID=48097 RepID=A0AAD4IK32_9PLEO|nr:hypothetical protein G6011_01041 [Alternaria panax]
MAKVTNANVISGANFDIYGANRVLPRATTAFTAIVRYNLIELLILVFVIFRRYSGLYFCSFILNAISIVPYATEPYTGDYMVVEKTQMTLFTIKKISIFCVYLWETRKLTRVIFDGKARKWTWQLVVMNILLLILDTASLTTELPKLFVIQTTFKSPVYSFKFKIEFAVLSQIVRRILGASSTW